MMGPERFTRHCVFELVETVVLEIWTRFSKRIGMILDADTVAFLEGRWNRLTFFK